MIVVGDCTRTLTELADGSVQMFVTSPPYFGLRDYGIPPTDWPEVTFVPIAGLPPMTIPAMSCCLGLEADPWAFVAHTVHVFRLARRVLKKDGTIWVNLGDSYAGSGRGGAVGDSSTLQGGQSSQEASKAVPKKRDRKKVSDAQRDNCPRSNGSRLPRGIKPKDMLGIPWMVAFALRSDGWFLRQDIIWNKVNPMPESAGDRCTKAHEYLFLLTKSDRYYFDADAIKERATSGAAGNVRPPAAVPGLAEHNNRSGLTAFAERQRSKRDTFKREGSKREQSIPGQSMGTHRPDREESAYDVDTRNKRSVWTVPTKPFRDAHFATYPEELIEPCILAGSRPGDTVLDPFMGAGTTAVVAQKYGRQWLGCELNPAYADIAMRRINGTTAGLALGVPTMEGAP